MVKTVSVADLGHGGASRAVRESADGPVLIRRGNEPAAWIVDAREIGRVAAARGLEPDVYQRTLELLALDLYRREVLTLGRAARLAGMPLGDFIDLCGRLHVPVLWESPGGVEAEVNALESVLRDIPPGP